MCYGENMPLDVLFVRDDDIPDLVQEDVCDLGIVGLNVIEEKRLAMAARGATPRFELLQRMDFGRCRLSLAVPHDFRYEGLRSIAGRRIATTYPSVARARSCARIRWKPKSSRCRAPSRSRRASAVPT